MEEPTLRFALLCLAVTLSGAAALTYELIWIRRLGEIFGQTVYAINIVLAVIFGGLGLGAYLFGRVADRMAGRISLFCVLELCIGLCGLLFLPLSGLVERLYLSLGPAEWSVGPALWVKGAFTALLLALPAVAMGGTLSALTRHVVRRDRDLAPRLGWLYGLNTLGAAAGVAGTSFLWLPRLGLPGTMVLAAAGNATAALLGFCFRLKGDPAPLHAPEPAAASPSDPVRTTYVIVAAAALAGFVGAGFEILWTRALSSRFLSTTYSFSVILLVFLAAMGLGSIVVALLDRVGLARRAMCALLFGAAGLAGAFSILQLSAVPAANQQAVEGFAAYQWSELRHALWVIGAPVFLLGCTFPLLVRLGHRRVDHVGREVGRVYLANTCGSVVSPLLFGFLLLPALGLKTLLLLTSWSCVLFAALFLVPWAFRRRVWSVVTASLLLASMTALWTRVPEDIRFWTDTETERLVAYREGLAASVSVVLVPPGNLVLKINNSYRLGDTRRVFAQARQGLIPLLLHPRPRRMLFLGVGTGGSAGAAAAHGGVDIDALEILPDLQDVLHHFRKSNFGFLERVRQEEGVRFLVVDARHFVQATERRYDVVVGDLFVPWRAGEGAMYTHAHFRAVRDVLDEGGLFRQWLPLYQLGPRELRIITATFCDVFPEASAWWLYFNAEQPALALVGSLRPQALDVSSLSQRLAVADRGELFKAAGLLDPAELLGSRICGRPALVDWSEQAPLETRAHPRIEFIAPWQRFRPTTDRTQEQLDSMFAITEPFDPALLSGAAPGMVQSVHGIQAALPHFLKGQRAQLADGDEARAAAAYADALAEGPEWALLQRMVLRRASDALLQERFDLLERCGAALARTRAHAHRGYYYMARAQYARGETETARRALQEALRIRPGDAGSLRLLEQIEQGG